MTVPPPVCPLECIQTPRLLLRKPRLADAAQLHAAILETMPALRRWMPWAQAAPTRFDTRRNMRAAAQSFARCTHVRYHVFARDNEGFVGACSLQNFDWRVPSCDIGYWCRASREGEGLMAEAVGALRAAAFQHYGMVRLVIRCDVSNRRSRALAERVGFHLEGVLHHESRDTDGTLSDTCVFALTRDRWQEDCE